MYFKCVDRTLLGKATFNLKLDGGGKCGHWENSITSMYCTLYAEADLARMSL